MSYGVLDAKGINKILLPTLLYCTVCIYLVVIRLICADFGISVEICPEYQSVAAWTQVLVCEERPLAHRWSG